jgi:hypothetical protein
VVAFLNSGRLFLSLSMFAIVTVARRATEYQHEADEKITAVIC